MADKETGVMPDGMLVTDDGVATVQPAAPAVTTGEGFQAPTAAREPISERAKCGLMCCSVCLPPFAGQLRPVDLRIKCAVPSARLPGSTRRR